MLLASTGLAMGLLACGGVRGSQDEDVALRSQSLSTEGVIVMRESGEEVEPVVHIDYENGACVGFFEPEPGGLTVIQWGPNGAEPPISRALAARHLKATELYSELTGDAAPERLRSAESRREELLAASSEAGGEASASEDAMVTVSPGFARSDNEGNGTARSDIGQLKQAIRYFDCTGSYSYDEWFNCNFCSDGGDSFDYTWMWVTGDGSIYTPDREYASTTVSVYAGGAVHFRVRKRPWYSWETLLDTYVNNGFWAQKEIPLALVDYDVSSAVSQAANDNYHWCTHGW